jgi:hypothetical protein
VIHTNRTVARFGGDAMLVFSLVVVQWLGSEIGGAIPIPILPVFLTEILTLYLLVVIARVLGVMYYVNRERLGWFRL